MSSNIFLREFRTCPWRTHSCVPRRHSCRRLEFHLRLAHYQTVERASRPATPASSRRRGHIRVDAWSYLMLVAAPSLCGSAPVLPPPHAKIKTVRLPIDSLVPEILDHLRTAHNLVLEAPPGAGKTTRVPAALLSLDGQGVLVGGGGGGAGGRARRFRGALGRGARPAPPPPLSHRRRAHPAAAFRSASGARRHGGAGRIPRAPSGRRSSAGAVAAVANGATERSAAGGDVGHARYRAGGGVSGRGAGDAGGGPAVSARNRIHAALGCGARGTGAGCAGASGCTR